MDYVKVLRECANGNIDICKQCDFERVIFDTHGTYCGNVLMVRAAEHIEKIETVLKKYEQEVAEQKEGCDHCNQKCATCYWYNEFASICDNDYIPEINYYCDDEKDGVNEGYAQDYDKKYCPRCGRKLV